MVDLKRLQTLFTDLLSLNSPSKNERLVADYLLPKLKILGFDVVEDDCAAKIGGNTGNLIAFKKGNIPNAAPIMLSSHMDTVEPTKNLKIVFEDGIIKSDGTTILGADDKAGLAAIVEGVESYLASNKNHGDIQLFFDVAEEIGLFGALNLSKEKIKANYCYIFDTQKPVAGITVSAPTNVNLSVEIYGKAAHAGGSPEKGISAILAASNAISKMRLGRIDEETTANIGVISGGKSTNIVADYTKVLAEVRSRDKDKLEAQVEHMKKVFEDECSAMGAVAKISFETGFVGFKWNETDTIVTLAHQAAKNIGLEALSIHSGGGSDANILNCLGIPAVVVGVGYEGAHSFSERILLDDLVIAAEFASSLLKTAASISNNKR